MWFIFIINNKDYSRSNNFLFKKDISARVMERMVDGARALAYAKATGDTSSA